MMGIRAMWYVQNSQVDFFTSLQKSKVFAFYRYFIFQAISVVR